MTSITDQTTGSSDPAPVNPDDAKASAVSRQGGGGTGAGRTSDEARENALTACKINTRGDCKLYAIGWHLAGN
jgi:hypothetical protein